ncbi:MULTISPECIES: SGNH/GDSL hydrolase family protein [Pseudomonas]|uniref:SGNH/GDSL hydrolase family protein n=1 Tax=Pseudomonas nitroreducens TaxID=46680 RepID=UPI001E60C698|nr:MULTISPECIES: SGNH/GDSL hydrolase family protein [Pseudomonas]MCE4072263.1 GDSL-type esterase/lipase family protein [Pseudomonas nitritireducens]MCE4081871.1 GDSL-type esterase/lipase family protein [Pseudomonas nitroreducens]
MSEQETILAEQALIDLYSEASLKSGPMVAGGAEPLRFTLGSTKAIKVVAQGDSWFDYLPGWDVIKSLSRKGYAIKNFGTGGDTLENMLFGNQYDRDWDRDRPEHDQVRSWVSDVKPRFFLFSGGGNDIAGPELAAFLNHADSNIGGGDLREDYLQFMMNTVFYGYYKYMVESITAAHGDVQILLHGYGRPLITGLGVVNVIGWHFIGPWLRPALTSKGIVDPARQFRAVASIIESLNAMLERLAGEHPGQVHYIKLLDDIKPRHWINELHLTKEGYEIVGARFDAVMQGLMTAAEKTMLSDAKTDLDNFLAGQEQQAMGPVGLE